MPKRPYTAEDSKRALRPLGTLGIRNLGPSYPWGGTVINDNFQDPDIRAEYIIIKGKRYPLGTYYKGLKIVSARPAVADQP